MSITPKLLVAALLAGALLPGLAVAAWAQSPTAVDFDSLHRRLLARAEETRARAAQEAEPPVVATVERDTRPTIPLDWDSKLSPQAWSLIQQSFESEGVPFELVLGWVESRFEPEAVSPKGARGVWQLMPATARQYGLEVSEKRDERSYLLPSTHVAARYLADLNRRFGDWQLALAAYNAGPERVEAAMARAGSRDFWALRPWLPRETREFVPAVLPAQPVSAGGDAPSMPTASTSALPAGQKVFAALAPVSQGSGQ